MKSTCPLISVMRNMLLVFVILAFSAVFSGCLGPATPKVKTYAVSDITTTSAVLNGEVTDDGGSALTIRGFKYAPVNPPFNGGVDVFNDGGVGFYSSMVTGLDPGTTYYVQAYAVNSAGGSQGEVVSFTTSDAVPDSDIK